MHVPDHARATVARLAAALPPGPISARVRAQHAAGFGHAAGAHRFLHRRFHRVQLMVARDLLPLYQSSVSQRTMLASWLSLVRFAAFLRVAASSICQISLAIALTIAAPIKNV